jgi:CHAD domain-containing protein
MMIEHAIALPSAIHRLSLIALTLFDQVPEAHQLPARMRPLLGYAADAFAAAQASESPDRLARDAILAAPLPDLDPEDRAIAACAAAFQRPKLRTHREAAFLRLDDRSRIRALRLAAILQLAARIAESPATQLAARLDIDETCVTIDGADAPELAAQAQEWGGLWRDQIGQLAVLIGDATPDLAPAEELELPSISAAPLALSGLEPAGEGARRVLRRFFERMLAREEDVRGGEDAEDLHQMRVATRRLRASLQVVDGIFDPDLIRRFRRRLRRAARSLGAVRDFDVFLAALQDYRATLPEGKAAALDPLIAAVVGKRTQARSTMLETLRGGRYGRFKHAFSTMLTTPEAGLAPLPETNALPRVRDLAGSVTWRRYEEWRAFEAVLDGASDITLHNARIAGKRLRYTLEFFSEALGPKTSELLEQLAALQEHLGLLQDGVTARAHIGSLGMHNDPGAQMYLAHLDARHSTLLDELPAIWGKVASATYRRRLFELIVKL